MFNTKVKFSIFNPQSPYPAKPTTSGRSRRAIFKEKGVSLYFGVIITSILLAMVLGVSLIIVSQVKIIKGMGDSVVALNAADTGVETMLFNPTVYATDTAYYGYLDIDGGGTAASSTPCSTGLESFPEDACYMMKKVAPGAECTADYYCIQSVGYFKKTRRAVEATR